MCTLTWFVKDTGYELFFNRDERKTRSRAQLPLVHNRANVSFISPTDTDAGGTWIATNHFGITVCLLNYYQFEQVESSRDWISRGKLVRDFAITSHLDLADEKMRTLDLNQYRAFRLFIIESNGNNRLFVWNGKQLKIEKNIIGPKSSSSVTTKKVKTARYQLYADANLSASKHCGDYLNFHRSHSPEKSALSVCMHRDDANTVSLSHVEVSNHTASFAYADGSPCSVALQEALTLDLI